jgi:hypothetical protein
MSTWLSPVTSARVKSRPVEKNGGSSGLTSVNVPSPLPR